MSKRRPLSWPDVLNNILLRLISTGQLPVLGLLLILGVLVYRTPSEHIVEVWRILQKMLDRRSGLGYGVAIISSSGWIIHTRIQRRRFEQEHGRMATARNDAQQKHFANSLKSSERK
jgi:hypothetical protein